MAGQTTWDKNTNVFDKVLAVDEFVANTISGSITFSSTTNPTITGELDLQDVYISNNLTVSGTAYFNSIVAITSSYSSGSTVFGDSLSDTHQFTGSVFITGSSFNWNNSTVIASNVTSSMSVASASQALTASYYGGTVTSASYALTASFLQGTVTSASYALTASFLQGTASQALTASKISISNLALDAGTYFPMFANNASGPVSLFADALTYTYQPSTNILTVTSSLALGVSASSINSSTSETYDGSNISSINWGTRRLQDSSGNASLSWEDRILANNASTTTVDWQTGVLNDSTGTISIDWERRRLKDTLDNISADYEDRRLIANDGATISLDWTTPGSNIMSGSLTIGNITSTPSNENTLNVYPAPAGGAGEGGQILLAASGGLYSSASMLDTWQNYFRVLRGTNTGGSNAQLLGLDLQTGNLSIAGALIPSAWTAGQVIKDTMLSNTEVTVSTTTIATSSSDTDFVTYSYTPVSSNSYLIIHYHLSNFDFSGGTGNDSYISRIKVDGGEITYSTQSTVNGNRTGVLFPLTGRYTNSSTAAKSIVVACRRNSADDSITITNSATSMWLRITEIAR
jgi:hypothetical protein